MLTGYELGNIPSIPKYSPIGIKSRLISSAMTTTSERLAEAMELRGVDQTELAARVRSTQGAISKIILASRRERGAGPRTRR
jgi:hypothetical protein